MKVIRKRLDIEMLLRWAFGYELLKSRVMLGPDDIGTSYENILAFGETMPEKVDDGVKRLPEALGAPHLDARIVEVEVRRLGSMEASWPDSRLALCGDLAALVPANDYRMTRHSANAQVLIMQHAKLSTRPPWGEERPIPKRIIAPNGKVKVDFQTNTRHYLSARAYCPLRYEPDPVEIAIERAEYAIWHGCLVALAAAINSRLTEYEALPPAAAPMPWLTGQTPDKKALDDGRRINEKLPLYPKRDAPLPPLKVKHGKGRKLDISQVQPD